MNCLGGMGAGGSGEEQRGRVSLFWHFCFGSHVMLGWTYCLPARSRANWRPRYKLQESRLWTSGDDAVQLIQQQKPHTMHRQRDVHSRELLLPAVSVAMAQNKVHLAGVYKLFIKLTFEWYTYG